MDSQDFYIGIRSLKAWFSKKLSDDQEDQWFDRVGTIPPEAFHSICSKIKDCEKFFPTPDLVKRYYAEWKNDNPHLLVNEHEAEVCEECDGLGYIWAWRNYGGDDADRQNWVKNEFACSACKNWKNAFPTVGKDKPSPGVFVTRAALKAAGLLLTDPHAVASMRGYKSIADMVRDIGVLDF